MLRIVRQLGQRVGLPVWCHGIRHAGITPATRLGQRAGLGLDEIRAHSRHKNVATLICYVDDDHRQENQTTLVAETLSDRSVSR